jgi:hypothetical protein
MIKTLEYYYKDGSCITFKNYTIDILGVIKNTQTGKIMNTHKSGKYKRINVKDEQGKEHKILVGRALASTFHGKPPTSSYTADHIDRDATNDTKENIRWATTSEQNNNRTTPETTKFAFIVIKDGIEKTIKEWVEYLKDQKNSFDREYTVPVITRYAQKKQFGFAYKEYPDLPGEVWKEIIGSKTLVGHWEISDMCRVKYITTHAENVLSGERLGIHKGYPRIRLGQCHILAFKTFYPDKYIDKKSYEVIMHKNDDKMNFKPSNLQLGTLTENGISAHDNGSYDGTKTRRKKCASYINNVVEKEYDSQNDAVKYLKLKGYKKVNSGNISFALNGKYQSAYDRVWKYV